MSQDDSTTGRILSLLAEMPARISAQTAGLERRQLETAPEEGEWSLIEMLAHLRACADVWGGCVTAILTQDRPTLRAVSPRTWIKSTNYLDWEFYAALDAYAKQRSVLIATLENCSPPDWARTAMITGAGSPLERTVFFYAEWLARHEGSHSRQVEHTAHLARRL